MPTVTIKHRCEHAAVYECPSDSEISDMEAHEITLWRIKIKLLKDARCPVCYPEALAEGELWSGYVGQAEDVEVKNENP
jgi:hypothetical protein